MFLCEWLVSDTHFTTHGPAGIWPQKHAISSIYLEPLWGMNGVTDDRVRHSHRVTCYGRAKGRDHCFVASTRYNTPPVIWHRLFGAMILGWASGRLLVTEYLDEHLNEQQKMEHQVIYCCTHHRCAGGGRAAVAETTSHSSGPAPASGLSLEALLA